MSESEVAGKLPVSPELASGLQPKAGKSYSEAVSSSSGELFSRIAAQEEVKQKPKMLSGAKRPRSPTESSCGRCFRTMHKTADCRHQVVCLRCSWVGHVAAHCKAEMRRSPKKNRVHIRSKRKLDSGDQSRMGPRVNHVCSPPPPPRPSVPWRASISLPLSPEISAVREELTKMAVLTILSGYVTDRAL